MNPKILFVDDDPNLLEAVQRSLRKQFSIETAVGGPEGLRRLAEDPDYALVVADMQMPEMNGLEFLRRVQAEAPDAVRMMLTGNADLRTAVDAVNDGHVFRFLTKPCPPTILAPALTEGLEQFRRVQAERELLENTLGGAVKVLTEILSIADPVTFERSQKLKDYVQGFVPTSKFGVSWELEIAALLSQIGRVTVPTPVLEKASAGAPLTGPENDLINRVPEFGARLIENIPRLGGVANIVRYQHKHFDGSGTPVDGPSGEEIPIGARILKVLGDLLEMERRKVERPVAFQRMREQVGRYDLKVLTAVGHWCDVATGELASGGAATPVSVRIEDIRIGMVLAQDICTPERLLLVAANTRISSMLLVKLFNFQTLNTIDHTLLVYPQ